MAFDRTESAKWSQVADETADKLEAGVIQALAKSASKGFAIPPGATLEAILLAGQDVKDKLAEANGKIYEDRRQVIFQSQEFVLKVLVRIAKMALEAYQAELFNALALEQAQNQAEVTRNQADVERFNHETEVRQVAIIRAQAEVQSRITGYKAQLVTAETTTLGFEELLIESQLQTATKKLEIIDSIYQVLAAEELVLAAEQRRAASLTLLLEAQQILATIKEEMIPFYLDKAKARQDLAVATTQEAAVREDIEKLGYDRIDLKTTDEYVDHLIREATEEYELADSAYARARMAVRLFRSEKQRLLQEYTNQVHESILAKKKALGEDEVAFKLRINLARAGIGLDNEKAILDHERGNLTMELTNLLDNMDQQGTDQAQTIRESAEQVELGISSTVANFKRIVRG